LDDGDGRRIAKGEDPMKYVLLLNQDEALNAAPEPGPAFEAYIAPWAAYTQALQDAGVMTGGAPLENAASARLVRVRDGVRQVEDGPYLDSKEQLGGFYIIDVPNLDAALDWAAKCPAALDGTVEVRPIPNWD
jgi:hypothetical protein